MGDKGQPGGNTGKGGRPTTGGGGIHDYGSNVPGHPDRAQRGMTGSAEMEQDPQDPMARDPKPEGDGGKKQGGKAGGTGGNAKSPDGNEGGQGEGSK